MFFDERKGLINFWSLVKRMPKVEPEKKMIRTRKLNILNHSNWPHQRLIQNHLLRMEWKANRSLRLWERNVWVRSGRQWCQVDCEQRRGKLFSKASVIFSIDSSICGLTLSHLLYVICSEIFTAFITITYGCACMVFLFCKISHDTLLSVCISELNILIG